MPMSSATAGHQDPLLCLPPGLPVSAGMALAEPPLLVLKSLQHRVTAASLAATLLRPWAPHAPQGLQGNSSLPILPLYPIHSKAQAWLLRRGCSDVVAQMWLGWLGSLHLPELLLSKPGPLSLNKKWATLPSDLTLGSF